MTRKLSRASDPQVCRKMTLNAHKSKLMQAIASRDLDRVESLILGFRFDDRWAYRIENSNYEDSMALRVALADEDS